MSHMHMCLYMLIHHYIEKPWSALAQDVIISDTSVFILRMKKKDNKISLLISSMIETGIY